MRVFLIPRWGLILPGWCWLFEYITMNKCVFFAHWYFFFSSGRESFRVLSAPGHAGSPPVHHGASVGPDSA